MRITGQIKWYNLYQFYESYANNTKAGMLSYQKDANQFLSNTSIFFSKVLVNPLELFFLKKWASDVVIHDMVPTVSSLRKEFPATGIADIEDFLEKNDTLLELLQEHTGEPTVIDETYQLSLCQILYTVDLSFRGTKIFNVLGTMPYQTLDSRLKSNLHFFKEVLQSKLVEDFLRRSFYDAVREQLDRFYQEPDIFTEAQVYGNYLQYCQDPETMDGKELFVTVSHVTYNRGIVHFLNTDPQTLQGELDLYRADVLNGYTDPEDLHFHLVVNSNLKVFFGFYLYTNWITANENWMVVAGRGQKQEQLLSSYFLPENLYHKNFVAGIASSMGYLIKELQAQQENILKPIDQEKREERKNQKPLKVLLSEVYSLLPGTAKIRYMVDIPLKDVKPETEYPFITHGYINQPEFTNACVLIQQIKNSLNAR